MGWSEGSAWDNTAWTGASGYQIGFAGDYPVVERDGFVTDSIHGQTIDPNGPTFSAEQGPDITSPVVWQDNQEFTQLSGAHGWDLDNLHLPTPFDDPGVGHGSSLGPAQSHGIDRAHWEDVYQLTPPAGHGRNFYGPKIYAFERTAWLSSSGPAPQESAYPAQAREDTSLWPEPFVAVGTIAPTPPVVVPDEVIDMRWMTEDDRPVYRWLAVPARNVMPAGNQWTPAVPSNTELYNVNILPEMPRTPDDPWATQEIASTTGYGTEVDVFNGLGIQ